MSAKKTVHELAVFRRFAAACPVTIRPDSIEHRCPPKPDILCEIDGDGAVAFEITGLDDKAYYYMLFGNSKLEQRFKDECIKRPEIMERLSDALISIDFCQGNQEQHIPQVLDVLQELPPHYNGYVLLEWKSPLRRAVSAIEVIRGIRSGPVLMNLNGITPQYPVRERINEKLRMKTYQTSAPTI